MYSVGCDIKQELSLVKNKIYSELIANKGIHVYQPEMFREFCISAGATKLFDAILDAITSARHSVERINLSNAVRLQNTRPLTLNLKSLPPQSHSQYIKGCHRSPTVTYDICIRLSFNFHLCCHVIALCHTLHSNYISL